MSKKEEAYKLYAEGNTYSAIGRVLGVSRQRIQQLIRPPVRIFSMLRKRSKDKCERCGIQLRLGDGHVHHKTSNGDFNVLKNLLYLCRSCHRQEHGKAKP